MSLFLVFLLLIEVLVTTKFANRDRAELARTVDRRRRRIFPVLFTIGTLVTLSGWVGGPGPPLRKLSLQLAETAGAANLPLSSTLL